LRLKASIAAALMVAAGVVFGSSAPAAAASTGYCASPSTQGHSATITMGGKLVATLRLKYCSTIRRTYGELTIDSTWKKTHSGYDARVDICGGPNTVGAPCDEAGAQWFNENTATVLLSNSVSIDSRADKTFWARVGLFKYNSCTTSDLPWTDTHDYRNGSNSGGIANRVCS
jgi:hypothetical protein